MAEKTIEKNPFNIFVVGRALIQEKGKYLLLERKSKESYANLWELPGGKLESLEAIKTAVIREVFEETGLVIELNTNRLYINSNIARAGSRAGSSYLNLIFFDTKITAGNIRLTNEHQKYGWFTKNDIFKLDLTEYMKMSLTEILLPRQR